MTQKTNEEVIYTKDVDKDLRIHSAAHYLKNHDYVILDTDWKSPYDTTDIVALDQDCLVLVKTRTPESDSEDTFPDENAKKKTRRMFENDALAYLICHDYCDMPMRFDIVDVTRIDKDRCLIKHHTNAVGSNQKKKDWSLFDKDQSFIQEGD